MHLSIGVLAWNEERSIASTLASLLAQDVFAGVDPEIESIEVIVVPNGCSDGTAGVARAALAENARFVRGPGFTWRVEELKTPGKANAWNEFVHRLSNQRADFLILLDADVIIGEADAISKLLKGLRVTPDSVVSTPLPMKDVALRERLSPVQWVSVRLSRFAQSGFVPLAGALYCGRGEFLRSAWLPTKVLSDDSFLKRLVVTDLFRGPEDFSRVIRVPGATVVFKARRRLLDVLHHQRRRRVAQAVNFILWDHLSKRECPCDAGQYIRQRNEDDADWVQKLIAEHVHASGWWVLPRRIVFDRFAMLRGVRLREAAGRLPVVLVAQTVDVIAMLAANRFLKRGSLKGVWRRQ